MYEEFFITDYEIRSHKDSGGFITSIDGLHDKLGEFESIDELNYLASLLDDMDKWDLEKFEASLSLGEYTGSVKDLINLAQNLDCYDIWSGIESHEDLGHYLIEELECLKIPKGIEGYFDYRAYGRDFDYNENGCFVSLLPFLQETVVRI